jgi:subtilisin family serine protease
MKKSVISFFLLALFSVAFIPRVNVYSQAHNKAKTNYIDNEILVKFKDSIEQLAGREQIAREIFPVRGLNSESLSRAGQRDLQLIHFDENLSVEEAVSRATSDPRVEYAEPNYIYKTKDTIPNDPYFDQLWGLLDTSHEYPYMDVAAVKAWDITTGSDDVVIAVLDTGIDLSHPDLAPNAWVNPREIAGNGTDDDGNGFTDDINGWNFRDNNNRVFKNENDWHGTHVAGTIGAAGNNGLGITGVAWHVKLMSLKFLSGENGSGSTADAVKAINYAIEQKQRGVNIRAINASWGGDAASQSLQRAINKAGKAGIMFVAAAGNEHRDIDQLPEYPAAWSSELSSLISVAAMHGAGSIEDFSNYGHNNVSVGAPGSFIYSTIPGAGYGYADGTSMAAPHVSGIIALLASHEPDLTLAEVKHRIITTVEPHHTCSKVGKRGTSKRV